MKVNFLIDLKTANLLGLHIPPKRFMHAGKVIEEAARSSIWLLYGT